MIDAGAHGPGDSVWIDLPFAGGGCVGLVLEEGWANADGASTIGDTALVRLEDPPPDLRPLPLRPLRSVDGLSFKCYGFPSGYDDSLPTEGRLGVAVGHEWVQLEVRRPQTSLKPGFSGSAVWNERHNAVVGLVVARHRESDGGVAFAIPARVLAERSRLVADAVMTPLDIDPDSTTHWDRQARGVSTEHNHRSWLFTGRRRALTELVEWVRADVARPRLRVITGAPGSGKSALLARLVTTADTHYQPSVPGLDPDDPAVPPLGAFDVTFHAHARSLHEFVAHAADVLQVDADSADSLKAALGRHDKRLVFAVDALDESVEASQLAWLLVELARQGHRVLVATRDHLVGRLGDPDPIRIDETPYLERNDVADYVRRLLDASGTKPPYRDSDVVEAAAAAEGNFLVAQFLGRTLAEGGHPSRPFPRDVQSAFLHYLDVLDATQRTHDLLFALAHGLGDGLSTDLWLAAVAALRRSYDESDLQAFVTSPAGAFLTTRIDASGGPRYRLFHTALTETLLAESISRRDVDNRKIWQAWTATLPAAPDGQPSWLAPPPYLCDHGAEHAHAAGQLDELLVADDYLLHANLRRVIPVAEHATTDSGRARTRLLQLTPQAITAPPDVRSALFSVTAALENLDHSYRRSIIPAPYRAAWAFATPREEHAVLDGHGGWVNDVCAFILDGQTLLASGSDDHTVRIWDPATRDQVHVLEGHTDKVNSVCAFILDGQTLLASGSDEFTLEPMDGSPNQYGIRVWDPATGRHLRGFGTNSGPAIVISFDLGGRIVLATASYDFRGVVQIWDPATGDQRRTLHSQGDLPVYDVCVFGLDGRTFVATLGAWTDPVVRVWDTATTQEVCRFGSEEERFEEIYAAASHKDEPTVLHTVTRGGTVQAWDPLTGRRQAVVSGEWSRLTSHTTECEFRVEGRHLRASVTDEQADLERPDDSLMVKVVQVLDAANGRVLYTLKDPAYGRDIEMVHVILIDGEEWLLTVGSEFQRTVRIWDARTGQERLSLEGHATRHVNGLCQFTVDGRSLMATASGENHGLQGADDAVVRIWDLATSHLRQVLEGHTGQVNDVCAFVHNGQVLVATAGDDCVLGIWDPLTGTPIDGMLGHTYRSAVRGRQGIKGGINRVRSFSLGDRNLLVSAGADGTVRTWDPATHRTRQPTDSSQPGSLIDVCTFQQDGQTLVATVGADRTVRTWNPTSGRPLQTLIGHTRSPRAIYPIPLGRRYVLASAGADGTVRTWDPASGRQEHVLHHEAENVFAVCTFVSEGRTLLASGGEDHAVRIWDATTGRQLHVLNTAITLDVCALPQHNTTLIASAGFGDLVIWDPVAGVKLQVLRGHTDRMRRLCPIPTARGTLLASGSGDRDPTVRIWNPLTGKQRHVLEGHTAEITQLSTISVHGELLLASAGYDTTVRIWDPLTGEQRHVLEGHTGEIHHLAAISFAGHSWFVSASDDRTVRIWDPTTGSPVVVMPVHHPARALAWTGTHLAIALQQGLLGIELEPDCIPGGQDRLVGDLGSAGMTPLRSRRSFHSM